MVVPGIGPGSAGAAAALRFPTRVASHEHLENIREVMNSVPPDKRWMHAYTYSGHPTCCAVALASDYNPGSSPSGNMNFVVALSCIQMKMLPEEAINAATLNGAYAMGLGSELGSITIGKKANLIFTNPIPSVAFLPYSFGTNLIDKVILQGLFID
jgi:hypothetical protein